MFLNWKVNYKNYKKEYIMKSLNEYVNRSKEDELVKEGTGDNWDPNIGCHKKAYNDLLKWYDKNIYKMTKEELIDCLKNAVKMWENDDFDNL